MVKLTKVVSDDVYENINSYVETNKVIVNDYEAMVNLILRMTKDGYCFTMDRDILRDAMESLTYMYAPDDDMNKDRLVQQLVDEDEEEDDSSEEGCEDFGNMDLMKMMQMMGGRGGPGGPDGPDCPPCTPPTGEAATQGEVVVKKEDVSDSNADPSADVSSVKECPVTGECCKEACSEGGCAEEELVPSENVD